MPAYRLVISTVATTFTGRQLNDPDFGEKICCVLIRTCYFSDKQFEDGFNVSVTALQLDMMRLPGFC